MDLSTAHLVALAGIGLVAGLLGGLVGIGGSIVMIPSMWLVLRGSAWHDQHLFQAAAMVVNVAVAAPATFRHRRAGAIRRDLFLAMLPASLVLIAVGVLVSNTLPSDRLAMVFAVFLLWIGVDSVVGACRKRTDVAESPERVPWGRGATVGGVMGFVGGLLGVGGGAVAVPLAHGLCRVTFREAIAASAAVMVFTAGIGAALKMGTLGAHGRSWQEALMLAAVLAPTALIGGYLGAGLTHKLPVRVIRGVFGVALVLAAARMSGLWN